MRKQLLIFSTLVAISCTSSLLQAQNLIGYSDGNLHSVGTSFGSQRLQGMAIKIPAQKAKVLKDTSLKGLRTTLRTLTVKEIKVFVTKDLSGQSLYEETFQVNTTRPTDFIFKTPVKLDGDSVFVGYTTTIPNFMSKPLSFDNSRVFPAMDSYALVDGEWNNQVCYELGAANLQLITEHTPKYCDLILKPFDASGIYKAEHEYSFQCQAYNMGTDTIKKVEISVKIGDMPAKTITQSVNIAPNTNFNFSTPPYLIVSSEKKQNISVSIMPIGIKDIDAQDNHSDNELGVLPANYNRKILAEVFTSQACHNCPDGEATWERASYNNRDLFINVKHHAGFSADRFSMNESDRIANFYNINGNPEMMLNRSYLVGNSVPFASASLDLDLKAIEEIVNGEAPLQISLQNQFDKKTRRGKLTVSVQAFSIPSNNEHFLNVFLTQDSIKAYQVGSSQKSNYVHNDILRRTLTGAFGQQIELKIGEEVVKTYDYEIPQSIPSTNGSDQYGPDDIAAIPENMNWIVFVADKTNSEKNSPVYNVAKIPVITVNTGILPQTSQQAAIKVLGQVLYVMNDFSLAQIYSTSGNIASTLNNAKPYVQLEKGIYIIKVKESNGQITTAKVMIP